MKLFTVLSVAALLVFSGCEQGVDEDAGTVEVETDATDTMDTAPDTDTEVTPSDTTGAVNTTATVTP